MKLNTDRTSNCDCKGLGNEIILRLLFLRKQCKVPLKLRYKPSQRVVLPLKVCVLVRLEFEIKLEPLLRELRNFWEQKQNFGLF